MDIVDKMEERKIDTFNRPGCGYYNLMMLCNIMATVSSLYRPYDPRQLPNSLGKYHSIAPRTGFVMAPSMSLYQHYFSHLTRSEAPRSHADVLEA